jgi:hypothetical protein
MLIDLFDNIINNISGEMTNSVTKDLILMMKDNKFELSSLKNDSDSIKKNILVVQKV